MFRGFESLSSDAHVSIYSLPGSSSDSPVDPAYYHCIQGTVNREIEERARYCDLAPSNLRQDKIEPDREVVEATLAGTTPHRSFLPHLNLLHRARIQT